MGYIITDKGHKWLDLVEKVSDKMVAVLESAEDDEISSSELTKKLGMNKADAKRAIELLEEHELIEEA